MVKGIVYLISLSIFSLLAIRNARDFCVLILYPATGLYALIGFSNFLVLSLAFSMYRIMHLKKWEFYFFSNLDSFYLFIYLSIIAALRISRTMFNCSGESGQLCLIPDFRGNAFSFLTLSIMFAVGFSYMAFIMLRYLESFYHKWVLYFVKGFLCRYWANNAVLIFQLVNMVYLIDLLANIEDSLHPWDKAFLVIICNLFNMVLDSVS